LNAAAFDAMRPGTLLVDVSRGGVAVHADLIATLQSGKIAGAGIDVFGVVLLPVGDPLRGWKT
jgi:phosphoglycerate dehydrogenase-like enzyme